MPLTPSVSLHLHTSDGITAEPNPQHNHVSVYFGHRFHVFAFDPDVLEAAAQAFSDAANILRAKTSTGDAA